MSKFDLIDMIFAKIVLYACAFRLLLPPVLKWSRENGHLFIEYAEELRDWWRDLQRAKKMSR